jgi:hypothetical protein
MASAAQIAANRANAARSTGPRTAQGKDRVSRNGLKHGNRARKHGAFAVTLLADENQADFIALRETYLTLCQPANEIQYFLVARMALAAWRLKRLALLETRIVSAHQSAAARDTNLAQSLTDLRGLLLKDGHDSEPDTEPDPQPAPLAEDPVADAYIRDSERGNTITKLARYQNTLERSYYLALHELEYRPSKSEPRDA